MDGNTRSKQPAAESAQGQPELGWLPVGMRRQDGERQDGGQTLEWRHFGDRPLTEPFYDDSVDVIRARDPDRLILTPLTDTAAWPARLPGLEPSGLIFHMSRCGSTLVAQMLAASDANIVVSEASPIDAVVRARMDEADRIVLLRAMAGALGQVRRSGQTRYFIKLDSWHVRALPLFRQAFPATPWVFVYREPAAVLISHVRRTGMQMVPNFVPPGFLGLRTRGRTWGEDYFARVLGAICAAAAEGYGEGGGLLLNYAELPQGLWTRVLSHFGVAPSAAESSAMAAAAQLDAKSPGVRFTPDAKSKRQATTAAIDAAAKRRLAAVYRRLEALRAAG